MANPSITELVSHLRDAPARAGATRVVLIDGPAGSGKTTLANLLATALGGTPSRGAGTFGPASPAVATDTVQVLHGDDMYEGWSGLATLDHVLLDEVLRPLAEGHQASFRMWDWGASMRTHVIPVAPVQYLVIEGVGVGQRDARPFASLVLYVDAPEAVRLERGLRRDGEHMRAQWETWQRAEEAHHQEHGTRTAADYVIDGTSEIAT